MKKLLVIRSSIQGDAGNSSKLLADYVARWKAANAEGVVVVRDLVAEPLPLLDGEVFGAFITAPESRTDAQKAAVALSDTLVAELRDADALAIGLPLYNFGAPAQFKNWIDQVARAGVTFRYTENGPVGLMPDRPTAIFASRGGLYAGTPADTQTPFVQTFLGFIGITSVKFVYAEGLAMGPEAAAKGLEKAQAELSTLPV